MGVSLYTQSPRVYAASNNIVSKTQKENKSKYTDVEGTVSKIDLAMDVVGVGRVSVTTKDKKNYYI